MNIGEIQSQYIGLMHYKDEGIETVLNICEQAKQRSLQCESLWRTERNYRERHMTDMLQVLVETGNKIKAISINRGWFEVDCARDLAIASQGLE